MDHVLHGLDCSVSYIDDVLIASSSPTEQVFQRFQKYGVIIDPIKCQFGKAEVDFLGHRINAAGISPLPSKTVAIREFPVPQTMKQLRQFLGMVNFYRCFLPRCAETLAPLTNILTNVKNCEVLLSEQALAAFSNIKLALANTTRLACVLPENLHDFI